MGLSLSHRHDCSPGNVEETAEHRAAAAHCTRCKCPNRRVVLPSFTQKTTGTLAALDQRVLLGCSIRCLTLLFYALSSNRFSYHNGGRLQQQRLMSVAGHVGTRSTVERADL